MLRWTASQSRQGAPGAGRPPGARARSGTPTAAVTGYTLTHAGRQVRFGPVVFWIAVGSIVIMAGWSAVTATYFAFRDDVLKGLIARQAEQQFAYEDRLAELRAQIDRTTSRQLLDQEQFERKLDELIRRQVTLESRATALSGVADPTPTGSIRAAPRAAEPTAAARPSPIDDAPAAPQRAERGTLLEPYRAPPAKRGKEAGIDGRLGGIEASLDRVERRQAAALRQIEDRYQGKARQMRGVLAELGVKLAAPPASGGPFVPVKLPGEGHDFERALTRVNIARMQAEQLSRTLVLVPVRKPVTAEIDLTSPFGVRMDPFLHVPAMHTGLDFRGEVGEPIRATAAGTVTAAGWSGGYGKLVEIDHGNGFATRYGHLSQINVDVGDAVRVGQIVGHLGSTGRSTGPHLHYETRINGEAVDPQKFLNAGAKLFGE
ncbi:MAG TPA: peptidoglycan DD-metalloendopeptidase family protein [Xanthobacteraceae bacterium]|nr:peptidoglycan DD-metalloendopeptidase family protein [Xanthobacteraceae bacterium]